MKEDKSSHAYWKATLGLLTKILIVLFVVSPMATQIPPPMATSNSPT